MKPTCRNLLMLLDLIFGSSFKVKRWFTSLVSVSSFSLKYITYLKNLCVCTISYFAKDMFSSGYVGVCVSAK